MINLLKDGIDEKLIIKTGRYKKLYFGDKQMLYEIYKVNKDILFFNDKNYRIAPSNIKYHTGKRDEYNNKIEDYILKKSSELIKTLKFNMDLIGQNEPLVILNDGRIIDGNKRFLALRHTDNKFVEAIILNYDFSHNKRQIKLLELSLQFGKEANVDYKPIDRYYRIYYDLILEKALPIDEYAQITNETTKELMAEIELVRLFSEYLDFIKAPLEFDLALKNNLDGAICEILNIIKEKPNLKHQLFKKLFLADEKDLAIYIKNINHDEPNEENKADSLINKIKTLNLEKAKAFSEYKLNELNEAILWLEKIFQS